MTITRIEPDSAAEGAGLQAGDVVTKIAGKRFKNSEGYLDATAKAASKPTYEIEYQRAGQARKSTLDRALRPAVTEQVVAIPGVPAAPVTSGNANLSVADELEKLAALRDKGILSGDEFEAQKKKLLSRGDQP
ncbi:SHOCT domain-containing protein [Blastomonas fulva]|uniref:SHOCT domain-containing protein n=1 Tax=Blastomonas fulva TaxID=1550728 RepID=UPI003F6F643F